MARIVLRLIVNAVAVFVAVQLLPGVRVAQDALTTYLLLGLIFGLVNAILKPILKLLTCPLILLTLGLFTLVINGLLVLVTAEISGGNLRVGSFGDAVLAGLVISIVNLVLETILGLKRDED